MGRTTGRGRVGSINVGGTVVAIAFVIGGVMGCRDDGSSGGANGGRQPPLVVTTALHGVWSANPEAVWAVGDEGTILHFDGRWQAETSPTTEHLASVWVASDGRGWAVGTGGVILRRDGGLWSIASSPVRESLATVWGRTPDDVWAVGSSGIILHFDGTSWSIALDRTEGFLSGVWGAAANDVWVVGAGQEPDGDRASLLLHWDGETWTESYACQEEGDRYSTEDARIAGLFDIGGVSTDAIWAAGVCQPGPGTTFIPLGHLAQRDGYGWTDVFGGTAPAGLAQWRNFKAVWASGPSDVWVSSSNQMDADPSAVPPTVIHFDGRRWSASSDLVTIRLNDLGGTGPNDIWGVGFDGKRLHYDGTAWTASP